MNQTSNLDRAGERRSFQCIVRVSWHTRSGELKTVRAKCLDISPEGARIECDQPMELRSNVYLQAPGHGLMGNASVRHCSGSGLKYIIGLLFSSAASLADQGRKRCIEKTKNEP